MSLNSTPRRNDYTGTGLLASYAFSFKVFSDDDLAVVVADDTGAEFAQLTKTTDYVVTGSGVDSGGSIAFVSAGQSWLTAGGKLKVNYHLTILGALSNAQGTSIRNQGPYFPNVLEDTIDKVVVLVQQLAEKMNRAVTFQKTATDSAVTAKSFSGKGGQLLKVNSGATGIDFSSFTDDSLAASQNAAAASAAAALISQNAAASSASSGSASAVSATASAAAAAVSAAAAAASASGIGTPKQEVLTGTFAAGDTTYTLSQTPNVAASVLAILGTNPQAQVTDYTISGKTITFTGQDTTASNLLALYRY